MLLLWLGLLHRHNGTAYHHHHYRTSSSPDQSSWDLVWSIIPAAWKSILPQRHHHHHHHRTSSLEVMDRRAEGEYQCPITHEQRPRHPSTTATRIHHHRCVGPKWGPKCLGDVRRGSRSRHHPYIRPPDTIPSRTRCGIYNCTPYVRRRSVPILANVGTAVLVLSCYWVIHGRWNSVFVDFEIAVFFKTRFVF